MATDTALKIDVQARDNASSAFAGIARAMQQSEKSAVQADAALKRLGVAQAAAAVAAQKAQLAQKNQSLTSEELALVQAKAAAAIQKVDTESIKSAEAMDKSYTADRRVVSELNNLNQAAEKTHPVLNKIGEMGHKAASGLLNMAKSALQAGIALAQNLAQQAGQAALQFGKDSISAAGNFQELMDRVKAQAAPATENMKAMGQAILSMSPAVGQGPEALAASLYNVESAGVHGKQALDLIRLSAEAASVGGIKDMSTVTFAAVSAMNSFKDGSVTAQKAVDIFSATVSAGNMTATSYAGVVSVLASGTANGRAKWIEANAALATFTRTGDTAKIAAQHLGSIIQFVGTQSAKMAGAAQKMHLTFDTAKFKAMDLGDKMQYLHDVTGGNFAEVQKLLGGNKTLAATYQKLYDNTKTYNSILHDLKNSHGATDAQFKVTSEGYNAQMASINAAFDSLKITVGSALLPILTKVLTAVTPVLTTFVEWANNSGAVGKASDFLSSSISKVAGFVGKLNFGPIVDSLEHLGATIMSTAKPALDDIAKWAKTVDWKKVAQDGINFVSKAIDGLSAVLKIAIPIIIDIAKQAIQFGQDVSTRLQPIIANFMGWWNTNWPQIHLTFKAVWDAISGVVKVAWALISGIIKVGLDVLSGNWKQAWEDIKTMFSGVWDGIKQIFKGGIEALVANFKPMLEMLAHIPGPVGDMARNVLKSFDLMDSGSKKSTEDMKNNTVLKMAEMKAKSLVHVAEMQQVAAKHFDEMRQKLITAIQNTSDPVQKHALEMKLGVVTNVEEMHKQAAKHAMDLANEVIAHAKNMKDGVLAHHADLKDKAIAHAIDMKNTVLTHHADLKAKGIQHALDLKTNVLLHHKDMQDKAITSAIDMKTGVSGSFNDLTTQGTQSSLDLKTNVSSNMTSMSGDANGWGSNIIQNFINGMGSMLGSVANMAGKIMQSVADHLKSGSPTKKGIGTTLMTWGPNIVKQVANGMASSAGLMETAANTAMTGAYSGFARHRRTAGTHAHKGVTNVAPTNVAGTGLGLLTTFNKDITTNSKKAHAQAEQMLSSLIKTMHSQSESLLKLHLAGNRVQEKQLREKFDMESKQFQLYKDMLKDHGLKFNSADVNDPINFNAHKAVKKGKKTRGVASGSGSAYGVASGTGSSGGNITIINVELKIDASHVRNDKELAKMIRDELGNLLRSRGVA